MKLSTRIKPISYLKVDLSEIVRKMGEECGPMIITHNGDGKVVPISCRF